MKKRSFTKVALTLSVCLVIVWVILGTGTTIAWFKDETPVAKNTFDIGDMNLSVSYKNEAGEWIVIDEDTVLFDENALYEPGYTQVVYLKIENKGDVDFDYKLSVDMVSFVAGTNEAGRPIYLPDYLKFGTLIEEEERDLLAQVATRVLAQGIASNDMVEMFPLNTYSSDVGQLDAQVGEDSVSYAAIVIYMPETVDNEANYFEGDTPQIELGVTVSASQRGTMN